MNYALAQEQRKGMRETNQDYVGQDATAQALLLTVADGMGGYFGGELAAEIAVGSILHSFGREARPLLDDPADFLERALSRANCPRVRARSSSPASCSRAAPGGTTSATRGFT